MARLRILLPAVAVVAAATAAALLLAGQVGTATAQTPVTPAPGGPVPVQETAATLTGVSTVGALFDAAGSHFCTASVVDSPAGNVLITAAHCITGNGVGLRFEPGYHDGVAPYGTWTVTAAYAAPAWIDGNDTTDDVAFLTVADQSFEGQVRSVQSVVGAEELATGLATGTSVDVVAYNDNATAPVACTAPVTLTAGWPTFDCADYLDGSSGSPWLVSTAKGLEVAGVIGGLHQGGCEPNVSYSSPFGPATVAVYDQAAAGAPGETIPAPPSDGCTTGL